MTKINLIFNENRNIQKEQSRLERMGLKDELAIVSDEHLLASAKPDQVYYDSQRKCGCFWSGVLDNEDELRSLWIQYRPQSTGNSAKRLAQLYEILSEKLFEKLDGCFVIVFVQGHQLHIVRDPMGVKTLYYTRKPDGEWLFSDQIKGLFAEGSRMPVVNRAALLELFALGPSHTEGQTFYKNIAELPMGYALLIRDRKESLHEYFELNVHRHNEDLAATAAHVRQMVSDSLNRQCAASDVHAAFLSGGLDSSILCALAAKRGPLTTYSLDYEDNAQYFKGYAYQTTRDNEYIDAMIERYAFDHHPLVIAQRECAELLEPAMIGRDGPGMADVDSSLLWMYGKVREQNGSVLTGECSDELFGGYPWFYRSDLVSLKSFPWLQSLPQRVKLLRAPMNELDYEGAMRSAYWATVQRAPKDPFDSEQDQRAKLMTYLTVHWFMQTLVQRQEAMAALTGLTVRAPFCDAKLYQYLYNVPWSMKFYKGEEKGLLRLAFEDILPGKVAHRKKNPYPKTYHPEYTQRVKDRLQALINDPECRLCELLEPAGLQELIDTDGGSFAKPWFGQLMMGPQLLAYFIQLELWLRRYQIRIEF